VGVGRSLSQYTLSHGHSQAVGVGCSPDLSQYTLSHGHSQAVGGGRGALIITQAHVFYASDITCLLMPTVHLIAHTHMLLSGVYGRHLLWLSARQAQHSAWSFLVKRKQLRTTRGIIITPEASIIYFCFVFGCS
jgi:hypothetical protein